MNNLQDVWDGSGGECDVMLHTKIEKFSNEIDLTMFGQVSFDGLCWFGDISA